MKKDVRIFLAHILESIELIEVFLRNISKEEFMESIQLQDAVVRRLQIIGGSVKEYSPEFQSQIP